MLCFRNIYTNDKLTPAQKNYQNALVNDWIDNNGKSSKSVNYLIKIDHRTASKSILAKKGFTPSTVNANEPEENVEIFKAKQYIYKTVPNEFFLDERLTQVEKAYLIAIDFAWIKNNGQQILPTCHLETVSKYFNFVKINTLKKYIRNFEQKGYIKYSSSRSGITNVSIDYTGNSIPEEFIVEEKVISPRIENNLQQQIDELKELVSNLQKQVQEQQQQIDELKASKIVETNTTIDEEDTTIDEEDCPLELLDNLEETIKPTKETIKPTEEKKVIPKLSKDSLLAIVRPDFLSDMKNEGLASLQHRSSSWNDLEGAEKLQNNMAQRKSNKEELTNYIIDYINNNKDIRNTINCLDNTYYKIFFTLAKTRVDEIKNNYWRRNIPTMDLSSISNNVA